MCGSISSAFDGPQFRPIRRRRHDEQTVGPRRVKARIQQPPDQPRRIAVQHGKHPEIVHFRPPSRASAASPANSAISRRPFSVRRFNTRR